MTVVGLGFRRDAGVDSLRDALQTALASANEAVRLTAIATAQDKAEAPALAQLAAERHLPVIGVPLALLAAQAATPSARVPRRYASRSLAEAAALAAAGPGARLLGPRVVSADGRATAGFAQPLPDPNVDSSADPSS